MDIRFTCFPASYQNLMLQPTEYIGVLLLESMSKNNLAGTWETLPKSYSV